MHAINSQAPWVLKEDGLYSNGMMERGCNSYFTQILFDEVHLSGVNIYTLIKIVKQNPELYSVFSDNDKLENLITYMNYINWDVNKNLYYDKFGKLSPETNHLLLRPTIFWDKENNVLVKESALSFTWVNEDRKNSVFGDVLESLLELPIVYDGTIPRVTETENNAIVYEPLIMGKLLYTVFNQVFSLLQGSEFAPDNLKYLP